MYPTPDYGKLNFIWFKKFEIIEDSELRSDKVAKPRSDFSILQKMCQITILK